MCRALCATVALAALSLCARPGGLLGQRPLTEDGYYVLTVARNVAHGRGITVDGKTATNGVQPLFTFLCVPGFAICAGGEDLPLRYLFVLHWAFYVGAAFLMGRIAADLMPPPLRPLGFWCAALVYVSSTFLFWQHFNGLETGCVLFMYLVAARCHQRWRIDTSARAAAFGAVLGLLVLARIDAVFLVASYVGFVLLSPQIGWHPTARLRRALVLGTASVLVSSPWWAYNYFGFGSVMPTSGAAQQEWGASPGRAWEAANAVAICLSPNVYAAGGARPLAVVAYLGVAAVVAAAFGAAIRSGPLASADPDVRGARRRVTEFAAILAAACVALVVWYTCSSWATHFYRRYFAPLALASTLVLAVAFSHAAVRRPRAAAALAVLAAASAVSLFVFLDVRRQFVASAYYDDQLSLVTERVPPESAVAAFQSGTLGFFRGHVVNLDGKVNPEALRRRAHLEAYLDENGIDWVCDWPGWLSKCFHGAPERAGWTLVGARGPFQLYHRGAAPPSDGTTPHGAAGLEHKSS